MTTSLSFWEIQWSRNGRVLSNGKQKVVVKSFKGAKTSHIQWYAKATIQKIPENVIIHCDTNDKSKGTDPEKNSGRYYKP